MTRVIEALLHDYERGGISRRELVKALALGMVPAGMVRGRRHGRPGRATGGQEGVLRGININHVNLQNSDLDRSVDFYRRLFSLPPRREVPGRPYALDLADGLSFLSVPQREPAGDIDHFCIGVEDFEPDRVATAIREAGLDNDLRVGSDNVSLRDPEGIRVQISWPDWNG